MRAEWLRTLEPEGNNFVETSSTNSRRVRVAHLSDLHIGKDHDGHNLDIFEAWLDWATANDSDVIVVSGDLAHIPNDRLALEQVRARLEATELPFVVVPGNHDIAIPGAPTAFSRSFGEFPRIDVRAGVAFILFDSFNAWPMADRDPVELGRGAKGHFAQGKLGDAQLEAMTAALEAATDHFTRIAVVHHHLFDEVDPYAQPEGDPLAMAPLHDAETLLAWCAANGVCAVMYGHKHLYAEPTLVNGVAALRGGRSTKAPYRARLLDVDPGSLVLHEYELS